MWEEIKEFSFPFNFVIGLISYAAALFISISNNFEVINFIVIVSPFLIGWFYFLIASYVKISFAEKSKRQKQFYQLVALSIPIILSSISSYYHFSEVPMVIPKFRNFLIVSSTISISAFLVLGLTINKQRKNKADIIFIVFIMVGLTTIFFLTPVVKSTVLKFISLLLGFSSLIMATIIRVKSILAGDELERQIHLETLAYTFPISLLFLYFIFVLQIQFRLNSFDNFLGYAPFMILLIYLFIVRLKKMKYS